MRTELPSGTVTFLFTDIEGSTKLLNELGTIAFAEALTEHRRAVRQAYTTHGGVEVDTQGDSFFIAFPTPRGALDAARDAQQALATGLVRVRMGVHTGTPEITDEGYVGPDVHRGARIAQAAHGGQVLVSAATAALVDRGLLRDLGIHRLRDLGTSERIHQLGETAFPPLRTAYQSNLPSPATPLVGREREVSQVIDLLSGEGVRMVTLTGPGGTGKTRLALAAVASVTDEFPDGVWWVPLAALHDPELVLEAASRTLGTTGNLVTRIGDKRLLLLFDNFEHVVDAAPDVAALLADCPRLYVVTTSRAALRVAAEHEYEVPPLASREAVDLFVARAAAIRPDLAKALETESAVIDLCRRLDDLPLAIELAAARVRVMSVTEILARLDHSLSLLAGGPRDQPERQRTLRATIEWSYDLLAAAEQDLFVRMAIFSGGCDLDAAQAVAGAEADVLQSLVEKSLVRRRHERFVMLETIREFALELLEESRHAGELGQRHAEYYVELGDRAEPHLFEFSKEWLDRLDREQHNLRAALDWLESRGDFQAALRLAGALQRFYIVRGHLVEGRRRLATLLEADAQPTAARAKALNGAALLAINTGDPEMALRLAGEALELHERLGDDWGAARSTFVLGSAHADMSDFLRARSLFEKSAAAFSRLGDQHNAVFVTTNLSWAHEMLGETQRARSIDEQNLMRAREIGNESIVALTLAGLGVAAANEGRAREGVAMLRQALEIDRRLGDLRRSVDDLCRFCRVLAWASKPHTASRLLAGAESLHAEIGATLSPDIAALNAETMRLIGEKLDEAEIANEQAAGGEMTFDEAFELALAAADEFS